MINKMHEQYKLFIKLSNPSVNTSEEPDYL